MNLSYSEKYKLAGELINKGYLLHCTPNEFKEFNPDFIVGGCRAKEGYGFYFSDMSYKSIEYGNNWKIIKKSDFNFLNSKELIVNIFGNIYDDFQMTKYSLESELDNVRNNRDYDRITQEIEKLKNDYSKIGGDDFFNHVFTTTRKNNIKTIGQLEYCSHINFIPKLINYYLFLGYDGYETDGIYTVFNIKKLNEKYKSVVLRNNEIELLESKINKIIKETIKKYF